MQCKSALVLCMFAIASCDNSNGNGSGCSVSGDIVASIVVNEIPTVLTVDYQATPDTYLVYEWSVIFDINQDGVVGKSDIVFGILEAKQNGETQRTVNFSDLSAQLLVYRDTYTLDQVADIDFTVDGNRLNFTVDRCLHKDLSKIDSQTQVNVKTYINTPDTTTYDYLPAYDVYTQAQDNSSIPDDAGDYYGDDARFDLQRFELQIIN